MENIAITEFYGIPIYALNEVAKSIKEGKFVTVDDKNRLVFHYTPLMPDLWLKNLIDVNEHGKLVNVDTSEDGKYWSVSNKFIKLCNEIFQFDVGSKEKVKAPSIREDEPRILSLFYNNILDGKFGEEFKSEDKSIYWYEIKNRKIIRYTIKRCTDEIKNLIIYDSPICAPKAVETWHTEQEILEFLRNYGWMINNKDVIQYSLKYIVWRLDNE